MRRLIIILLLIAGTAGAAILLIPRLISEETVRQSISRQLTSLSGSQVDLAGAVNFTVYPNLGFAAESVSVGAPEDQVNLSAEEVIAAADLFALISGQIKIKEVRLQKPKITLNQHASANKPSDTESDAGENSEDVFRVIAAYLENLSVDRLSIVEGTVWEVDPNGSRIVASDLDIGLSAPGLGEALSLTFDGLVEKQKVTFSAELGSLGELLSRQPTAFQMESSLSPPPHPLLADIVAAGNVQLASDGSYRVQKGTVEMAGQAVKLDVVYTPGNRPHLWAKVAAGRLVFQNNGETTTAQDPQTDTGSASNTVDFGFAKTMDLDLELQADAVQTGDAIAEQIFAVASLKKGKLEGVFSSKAIAKGNLSTEFTGAFVNNKPEFRGRFTAEGIDLTSLAELAAISLPLGGNVNTDMRFAFRAGSPKTIRNTLNVAGKISLADGTAQIPQLNSAFGPGAETIREISASANISGIQNPVNLSGNMNWKGDGMNGV